MKRLMLIGITLLFSNALFADGNDPLWEKYINAQIKYQDDIASLFSETHPELKELIGINHDLQVTMTKISQRHFYYLLEMHPSKIIINKGISKWTNFDWTEEDEELLLKIEPKYVALIEMKADLYEKNQNHTDWPAYRKALAEAGSNQRYKDITKAFMEVRTAIEEALKKADNQGMDPTESGS